jgi:type VI protein secretion system component VasK
MLFSWLRNRELTGDVDRAASHLDSAARAFPPNSPVPSDALQALDAVRAELALFDQYRHGGPPLAYRLGWGLFNHHEEAARSAYFEKFDQWLLAPAQTGLLNTLLKPGSEYGAIYEALKAYLMTTSASDNSDSQFLAPVTAPILDAQSPTTPRRK